MSQGILQLMLFDHVRLRKPHPCGSYDWRIFRLGADVGLKCDRCGRKIYLPRVDAERRIKKILEHGSPPFSGLSEEGE